MAADGAPPERALQTPRAAGVAGIISALLMIAALVLVRTAIGSDAMDATAWATDSSRRDTLQVALDLVPFAGIFFLWFMGAVRSYVGPAEDRFFATLFMGGGLLFVAMLFILAATTGVLLATADSSHAQQLEFGRGLALTLLSGFATRMAAVFALSTTAIGRRLGIFPRWLAWLGYLAGLVLILPVRTAAWIELVFPAWVLAVSGYILLVNLGPGRAQTSPQAA